MDDSRLTCWTLIERAAGGDAEQRQAFARKYEPAIRAYLSARWRGSSLLPAVDDAAQVVFVECLKDGGVLSKASPDRAGGFRAFLYGAVRNVARRFEEEAGRERDQACQLSAIEGVAGDETHLSVAFDRVWARQVMKEAAVGMQAAAAAKGEAAVDRVELLRLRFNDGLPIRTIADRWNRPAEMLHREYAKARKEFHEALLAAVSFHFPDDRARAEQEVAHLLAILG